MITPTQLAKEVIEVADQATRVVAWYKHSEEVRGPYHRWFKITGPKERNIDSRGRLCHASQEEDLAYATAALNHAEKLAKICLVYEEALEKLNGDGWASSTCTAALKSAIKISRGDE